MLCMVQVRSSALSLTHSLTHLLHGVIAIDIGDDGHDADSDESALQETLFFFPDFMPNCKVRV
jgi:hypothetical protein